ncbi:FeoB-associated Cys-rich membrane protein [Pseudomonas sp.]|uniref:FeoB-associated Cys-rich membrane protein n=1 Tax=Pseudomonas sp. TaxID=306 RepID=UPI0039C968B5
MSSGLIAQYVVIAAVVIYAAAFLWRRLKPSKGSDCGSGCGSCSSGCQPPERIPVRSVDARER